MYLDFTVDIPDEPGKISCFRKGGNIYVRYVVERTYHPDRKYNIPNHKIIEDYHLQTMLTRWSGLRDCGLFLDLAAYSIICENNAGQYYPDYAYNHPLFTEKMHIYSRRDHGFFISRGSVK